MSNIVTALLRKDTAALSKALAEGADPNQKYEILPKDKETYPLLYAAANGLVDILEILVAYPGIELGVNTGFRRRNALHVAVENGRYDAVLMLIERGYDVNIQDSFGFTPLHLAVFQEDHNIMKLLLNHPRTDTEIRDYSLYNIFGNGKTALMWSFSCDPETGVGMQQLLLAYNADPNVIFELDMIQCNLSTRVQIMLEHGANPMLFEPQMAGMAEYRPDLESMFRYFMNHVWKGGVPSLTHQCIWKLKLMRSRLNEESIVDYIPDACVYEHFRNWKGASKWCVPWVVTL